MSKAAVPPTSTKQDPLPSSKQDWADDFDNPTEDHQPSTTDHGDGTRTEISYHTNDDGRTVRTTRLIRTTIKRTVVNSRVAARRAWPKFGLEKGRPAGPQPDTTTLGEEVFLHLRVPGFKKEEVKEDAGAGGLGGKDEQKEKLKNMKVKCRICDGDHFTAKCPFKDTMAPKGEEEPGAAGVRGGDMMGEEEMRAGGGLGAQSGGYVPPHLRKGGQAASGGGERMGGRYERDDLATLRVTNVSEFAEENDLRDIFERFGRVTRVFLAKDRETGRAKGFAFISFQERSDAAKACEKIDGYGYGHLILRVEFAKRAT